MKRIFVCLMMIVALLTGTAVAEEKLKIVATDFPCYDFARQVAGDWADVMLLIRPGLEVHSYEPSPSDILQIGEADLFVYIGGESDAWVRNILAGFDGDIIPEQLCMMDVVQALEEEGEGHDHDHDHADEDHDHDAPEYDEPEYDEHIWTSPQNAALMVRAMEEKLCLIDPVHADDYHLAGDSYVGQIDEIDVAFEEAAANSVRKELIFADRFPFLYFAKAYGLDYIAAFPSCTAETEPSPQTMMELINRVQEDNIPVIYTIEMSTQSVARTIAEETGVEILTMHSVQTVTQNEFEAGESYVSLMWKNVEAVQKGLN